ncbi:hypothetical protein BBK36DRAFT_1127635 [Trichoderma citrinoviride]|uniref:Glutathione S-transferase n=1 Tax=Trichoderma citrinoviride TaxID=58853 RepID=A0A2T4B1Z7_9HYPO|nr:hypothetical protein BBK36DRAFT_1127635 [Trichoderma citrinoviride]PTB63231.1 hypothetical protein BBK36DRAFT_1127635 [Trichoderma citrinoviride]
MSTPVLHYFRLGSLGRGEIIRVFLRELNIEYEDKYYAYDDTWPGINKSQGISITGTLPVLEIDGQRLYQHLAILRYLARRSGAYDGETNYEKYLVDAVADMYNDWRTGWVNQLTAKATDYKDKHVTKFNDLFTHFYALDNSGPYLLGNRPTYVDFAVFQALDNDECIGCGVDTLSEPLKKLREAIHARPNIERYLAERAAAK